MAIVRILVDGYSLLYQWPELAPRAARYSQEAREALIQKLTQYRDATSIPVTIFFDGQAAPGGTPKIVSTPEVEILFSRAGQTADDMIERTAFRLKDYGEPLVVTDDFAERDTVIHFGGVISSCRSFISQVESAIGEMANDLKSHNRRERDRFRNG